MINRIPLIIRILFISLLAAFTLIVFTNQYITLWGPKYIPTFRHYFLYESAPDQYPVLSLPFKQGYLSKLSLENLSKVWLFGSPGPILGGVKDESGKYQDLMVSSLHIDPENVYIFKPFDPRNIYHLIIELPINKPLSTEQHLVTRNLQPGIHNFTTMHLIYQNGNAKEYSIGHIIVEVSSSEIK